MVCEPHKAWFLLEGMQSECVQQLSSTSQGGPGRSALQTTTELSKKSAANPDRHIHIHMHIHIHIHTHTYAHSHGKQSILPGIYHALVKLPLFSRNSMRRERWEPVHDVAVTMPHPLTS